MDRKILLILAGMICHQCSVAQSRDSVMIKSLSDEIMANSNAYENLRVLCKQIGPRLSGSAQAQQAVLATEKMLKDAGADTVYLQPCLVTHWIRGEKETGFIRPGNGNKYRLNLCALGNSVATGNKGISGQVIEVKNFEELEQLDGSFVKGKIIFFNFSMNPTYIETFRAYGECWNYRGLGPLRAAKKGAIAVMIRSLASNTDDYPHTGTTIYNDSFPKIPAVAISTKDAEWLSIQCKKNRQVTGFIKTNCRLLPDVPSYNVIGEIRGIQAPSEIITVGGHLDSWDLAEGAQDDGAGCVQAIEIIRAFKKNQVMPKRTIRAIMFMNEENGGKGAKEYLSEAKRKKEHHIFALESDGGGYSPRGFSFDMNEGQLNKVKQWKYLFENYGVYMFTAGESGSDIEKLKEIGTALAGLNPDSQRYFDVHHSALDTFESVSKRELDLGAVNMVALCWLVSEYGL